MAKAVNLFGLGSDAILKIDTDKHGHLCLESLDETLQICQKQDRPILMVTSVAGSTEFGGIDPVHKVNQILQKISSVRILASCRRGLWWILLLST